MKKLYLIQNPEVFQGQLKFRLKKNYFEGWYFKNTNALESISFIPGIHVCDGEKKAFIQVITKDNSYYINYGIEEFEFSNDPFFIKIGDNKFSKDGIFLDIKDESLQIEITGELSFSNGINIKTNKLYPNIMGPFSYLPFMECNHAILSMKHRVKGHLKVNQRDLNFKDGVGYIEKDFGISFPKSYMWLQGNCFKGSNASFMLSIANVPLKFLEFQGIICVLIIDGKEYKFTTYNGARLKKLQVGKNSIYVLLKKGSYILEIETFVKDGHNLLAPVKGSMEKSIRESITSRVKVTLKKSGKMIFSDTSKHSGLEIVDLS